MPTKTIDGIDFEIPEGPVSGKDLQGQSGLGSSAVPVVKRKGRDMVIEPDEVVNLEQGDRVIYTTPMEAACW